ncbi:C39 family peptidase [Desulfosporosinus sp. BG]|uniref:C39 family peptidase n=1 Tax=Desulfosporosinus sp. BG TaxID=1633135 RepID=UPI00083A49F7|nr:C39 family peptidase [Desulfosporosinus sp. BG]ODA41237.1 hypothetical protein DSBG_2008 [Desulfosporosinus sp. BG]
MKIPLKYQSSEYDCVPTSFLNALNFLFDRKEIPPEVIKAIMLYSLDTFNRFGEVGKGGTTGFAIGFICEWLNYYNETKGFNIECERVDGTEADFEKNKHLVSWLKDGGVVLARVFQPRMYHYILITHIDEDSVYAFDPYFRKRKFDNPEIEIIQGDSLTNRRIMKKWFNSYKEQDYSLSIKDERVCVLMRRIE